MYKRRDKNTNFHVFHIAQTKFSIKHISNIYGGVMRSEKKLLVIKPIILLQLHYDKYVSLQYLIKIFNWLKRV